MSQNKNAKEAGLRTFLTGYGRNNPAGLEAIAAYEAWPLLAGRETARRMVCILEAVPDEEVMAVARLEINLKELACQVLVTLGKE